MSKANVTYLKKGIFNSFTRQYSLSKTLRFELKPLPGTKKFLLEFIDSDTQRDKDYQELKRIIDEYHKVYIEKSLAGDSILDLKDMQKLDKLYHEQKKIKSYEEKERIKKEITDLQSVLRKQIVKEFKDQKKLFGKELLEDVMPQWLKDSNVEKKEDKKEIIKGFKRFSTYLTGFHENRRNIYSDKEQSTAVSHRIINENFPKFSVNGKLYDKIKKRFPDLFKKLNDLKSSFPEEFQYFGIESVEQIFAVGFFNKCLNQRGIDNYNAIVGGKVLKNKKKIQGLNEIINIYRQENKENRSSLPSFQFLYKQILSDRESHSFLAKPFENNEAFMMAIDSCWKKISEPGSWGGSSQKADLLSALKLLFSDMSESHLGKIYFSKGQLSYLSQQMFDDWRFIQDALEHYIETKIKDNKVFSQKKIRTGRSKKVKGSKTSKVLENEFFEKREKDFFSFEEIHNALISYRETLDTEEIKEKIKTEKNNLLIYFQSVFSGEGLPEIEGEDRKSFIKYFEVALGRPKSKKNKKKMPDVEKLREFYNLFVKIEVSEKRFSEDYVESVKIFLDSIQSFLQLVRPVYLEKDRKKIEDLDKDCSFYGLFDELYDELFPVISLYNKCRNFIATSKKNLKKIKINFEDSTLLNGWDVNKEIDNLSVILRKKENDRWHYYLGIMNKKHNKIFDYNVKKDDSQNSITRKEQLRNYMMKKNTEGGEYYEKMRYKQISSATKDIQNFMEIDGNVCRRTKDLEELKKKHLPSETWKIKQLNSYNSGDGFNKKDLSRFIGYYKKMAEKYWSEFNLFFYPNEEYKSFKHFTDHIQSQGYKLSFDKIKADYIDEKINSGELYLFKVYNKDFSSYSKGKPNLHTMYFKSLFEEENLKDTVFKLNGKAEVFYRKASKKRHVTHPKNKFIDNKNSLNPKKESKFAYDIIKDKRFTENKFFFHLPITLNFKETKKFYFNQKVLQFLRSNKDVNIIGIDRGERHLAYYMIINQKGETLKQGSFNVVENSYKYKGKGKPVNIKTDYHKLLDEKEEKRDKARKSWTEIESIKDLKAGYLSHLVHQVSRLMIDYNAIICLEDLNFGFKRGRMKFEKQVYQKFEKALIDKLNYLVFKDIDKSEDPGGYLNAYQLTAPFESFQKMGKQTGFVFYIPAYYTSKICPITGFVNLTYLRYKNIKESKDFFGRFEKVYFNSEKNYFVFEYQDGKVNSQKKTESNDFWTVCTYGQGRYKYDRKSKTHKKIDVTQEIKNLFNTYKVTYRDGENLIKQIIDQSEKDFFVEITNLLRLTLQLRHINPEAKNDNEKDFILSPVADETGRFFDSRRAKENEPKNADANGAYHIALKGLKTLQDISQQSKNSQKLKVPPIKNKDWFYFVRNRKTIQKQKAG